MEICVFIAAFIMGALVAGFTSVLYLWEKFMSHGGILAIDERTRKMRFFINEEDVNSLEEQRYVILKVSNYDLSVNRLPDTEPLFLGKEGGKNEG